MAKFLLVSSNVELDEKTSSSALYVAIATAIMLVRPDAKISGQVVESMKKCCGDKTNVEQTK